MAEKVVSQESKAMIDELIAKSRVAQEEYAHATQEEVDKVCYAVAYAVYENAERLAELAVEETGRGNVPDKINKNKDVPSGIYYDMKNKKSVGVVRKDEKEVVWVAKPKGVIGNVSPATNPVITPAGNGLFCLKCRDSIIVSPHPAALKTSTETVNVMRKAIEDCGWNPDLVQIVTDPSNEASQYLMSAADTVIATGGNAMVKAAYSSGTPAYGVGAGNMQVLIAPDFKDYDDVAKNVIAGRSFDYGSVCAGDQCVICPESEEEAVLQAFRDNHAAVITDPEDVDKIRQILFNDHGITKAEFVAHSQFEVAKAAGIEIPEDTIIMLVKVDKYGKDEILCREKLCPVTAFITYDGSDVKNGMDIALANVHEIGMGHSSIIWSYNDEWILQFAEMMPVGRIIVRSFGPSAAGAAGANGFETTCSIGTGAWGGNSISLNLSFEQMMQWTRIGYPTDNGSGAVPFEERFK
jgi:succinate-semialdehyde dehydrogenase